MCHLSTGLFMWLKLSTFKAPPSAHAWMLGCVFEVPALISVYVCEIRTSLGNPTQPNPPRVQAVPFPTLQSQHNHPVHLLDEPIFHVDVCIERLVVIDDLPTFDQKTIALQQRSTQQLLIALPACSVTPEMKEEGWKEALHYSGAQSERNSIHLSTAEIKMLCFVASPFIVLTIPRNQKGEGRWVEAWCWLEAWQLRSALQHHHHLQQKQCTELSRDA